MFVRNFLGHLIYILIQPGLLFLEHPNRAYVILFEKKTREVLMVKNWLSLRNWGLPGGGVNVGESHLEAAMREVSEEIYLELEPGRLRQFCALPGANRFRDGRRSYFLCHLGKRTVDFNRRELVAARRCRLDRLPRTNPQVSFVLRRLSQALDDHNG